MSNPVPETDLPACLFRGRIAGGRCECHSPQIASAGPVSLAFCRGEVWGLPQCKYATTKPGNAITRPAVQNITPSQANPALTPSQGPGTELKALLASVGIHPGPACPCMEMMRRMNEWGVAGCREHRGEIVMHVQEQMGNRSWREKLSAAAKATTNGLAFSLNPVDIPGSLVDEAIRRAEA